MVLDRCVEGRSGMNDPADFSRALPVGSGASWSASCIRAGREHHAFHRLRCSRAEHADRCATGARGIIRPSGWRFSGGARETARERSHAFRFGADDAGIDQLDTAGASTCLAGRARPRADRKHRSSYRGPRPGQQAGACPASPCCRCFTAARREDRDDTAGAAGNADAGRYASRDAAPRSYNGAARQQAGCAGRRRQSRASRQEGGGGTWAGQERGLRIDASSTSRGPYANTDTGTGRGDCPYTADDAASAGELRRPRPRARER